MRRRTLLPAAALAGTLALAACGSDAATSSSAPASSPSTTATSGAASIPSTTVVKPEVKLPATPPTSLVSTVVTPGSGVAAATGDAVVVRYVGVRSEDGTEFDNNFDNGDPFTVQLGAGSVIQGWDQGLVGVQTGERLQLDIPADLAYGDNPQGEIIQAGDALSFVIDVLAVVPATTEADQPQVTVTGAANRSDLLVTDLVDGTGAALQEGQHAVIHIVAFRGDTGEQVYSTYTAGQPLAFQYGVDDIIPGIVSGLKDMKVGGRRQLTIPFEQAFGADGSETLGIPTNTDVVLVVDLVAVY
ncbi:MAG: FKBP-type peptidyl-prolyl cis-trans isomerase [Ilumatobacteraceae bacterium]